MNLADLGWNSLFEKHFEQYRSQGLRPARISKEHKNIYLAIDEDGELSAEVSGKYRYQTDSKGQFPSVGDWVAISRHDNNKAIIHALLPRKGAFVRKEAGARTNDQVIASNIDTVFVVCGLDGDFNPRRIERYLTLIYDSGAMPVILLNKRDLCDDFETKVGEVESLAIGLSVYAISAIEGFGLDNLKSHLVKGNTTAFIGSSGAGKSSIINRLLGDERLRVNSVREDDSRGKHTTTHRELIVLQDGGIVIDTPGMREIQVWGEQQGLKQVFDDIEGLAAECRFRDCNHQKEPGCAVREAIDSGLLDTGRFQSYLKLKKEHEYLAARQVMKASSIERLRWKQISQSIKGLKKSKG
jgi:ribosome biogenesis GTPase